MTVTSETQQDDTRQGWRLLRLALGQQRGGLAIGVVVGLFWAVGKVSVPQLTKMGIDRGIEGSGNLVFWSGLVVAAGVIAGLFTAMRRWYAFRESRWIETRLREQIFSHLLKLHVGYHDKMQTGQLMSRASSDLQQLQAFVVMIPITLSNFAMLIAVVALLIASQPMLALFALAPLPIVNVMASRFSRQIHPVVLAVQQEQAQLATVVEESVSGVRVIKGFGAEQVPLIAAKIRSKFLPALDLLPSIGLIAVLGIGGHRVINEQMTVGDLVKFNAYITMLIWPLRNLAMTVALAQRASVALVRVDEVLSTPSLVIDPLSPTSLPVPIVDRPVGEVIFDDTVFAYEGATPIIDHFSVTIQPGQAIALVGATGSGKSTVVRLLTRFHDVQQGSIRLDGIDVRQLKLSELRTAVGIVFEETFLFHDSVAELPHGYQTILGERGYSLSGGQRQRIAIARAIVSDPRVLVLDDATSAVDPSKEHEIREAMATVMKGRTTIVIAHRPGTIALADTVILLDEGRAVAVGTHEGLLANNERYRQVLAAWEVRESDGDDDEVTV